MEIDTPIRVTTKPRVNLTEALRRMAVGDTYKFPVGVNGSSLRTLASTIGYKIHLKTKDDGIEVTRRC